MFKNKLFRHITLAVAVISVSACGNLGRLKDMGQAPDLTPIKDVKAPAQQRSISLPMPDEKVQRPSPNSLWRPGAKGFFKDQRARRVGDIVTVNIAIQDQAQVANTTARTRATNNGAGLSNFLGVEKALPFLFTGNKTNADGTPQSTVDSTIRQNFDNDALVGMNSSDSYTGNGTVNRSESINMTVAAIVTDVLPNGNLVIQGRQEVRVNFEKRELLLAGIVRPEDISSSNVIQHSQIAEARISYGGKGQLSDVQQPRYGTQLYDIIFPF